jgi:hypothetical protein
MSGLVVPTEGEIQLLTKMVQAALSTDENYIMKLFNNNHAPASGDSSSNYTETGFVGYTAHTLTRSGWVTPTIVSGAAQSTYTTQTWTCSGTGDTLYGYYVLGATSGKVLWAEAFASARTLANGDQLNINPQISLQSVN